VLPLVKVAEKLEEKINKYSAVAEMGNRLATRDMDRKLGDFAPLGGSRIPI